MANHLSEASIQTLLAVTPVSALTAGQMNDLTDALNRTKYIRVIDSQVGGAVDPTLATVFPAAGNAP
jgi:hypothetical protein